MENTKGSATSTATETKTTVNAAPSQAGSQAPAQAAPAGGQQPAGTQAPQSAWDYKSDPRWGKVFKTEADIINGYHSLEDIHEKKYKPSFQELSDIKKMFTDNKLDFSKVADYIKDYQETNNPENPKNQMWNFLNELIDDDVTAQDFQNLTKKLQEEKLNRRFPNMSQEQRSAAIARDKELNDLKSWRSQVDHEKAVANNLSIVQSSENSIKKLCSDKGFEFTDNIKQEFWKFCMEEMKQFPEGEARTAFLKQMPYTFVMKYGSELDKSYENKIKSSMIEQQKAQKATTVTFAKKPEVTTNGKARLADRLRKYFPNQGQPAQT